MTAATHRRRPADGGSEGGFTLVEVLISVVLLTLIMGALSAAFVTSMKLSASTAQHTKDSNDAQLIAANLVKDAQAAGATDAVTGQVDPKYGIAIGDATGCAVSSGDAAVVRFEWLDRFSAATTDRHDNVAVYYYVPPTGTLVGQSGHLVRQTCVDGTAVTTSNVLARNLPTQPTATCDPACAPGTVSLPKTVSMTVSELQTTQTPTSTPTHFTYTLTASTRPEGQPAAPPNATGSPAPLVLLGDDACNGPAPLSGSANVPLKVFGNAFIEGGASSCDAFAVDNFTVTGHTEAIAPAQCPGAAAGCTNIGGITARDPYTTLAAPPTGAAGSQCAGPADDQHAQPGHFAAFSVAAGHTCNLASGVYYVDGDFNVAAGAAVNTDGGDVLIYLASGQFSIDGKLSASALAGTQYDGMVLWQAATDTQPLATGASADVHLNGVVYAPGAELDVAKRIAMKAFVGKRLKFAAAPGGDPSYDVSQIGLNTPTETEMLTGAPPTLPAILDQAAADETITINGSNFQSGATVAFSGGGINPPVQTADFVSPTQIKVSVSIDAAATASTRDVVITNPDGGVDIEDGAFKVEPRPLITSVTLANGIPPNNGVIETGDTITVVFSKQMRESSICSTWTGADDADPPALNADGDVTVVAKDGGAGPDTIDITSTAGCNGPGNPASLGTIDLGGTDYVTGGVTETFAGGPATLTVPSTITWTAASNTLVITLGTETPAPVPPVVPAAPSAPTYTAPPRFTDTRGAAGGLVTPPNLQLAPGIQF